MNTPYQILFRILKEIKALPVDDYFYRAHEPKNRMGICELLIEAFRNISITEDEYVAISCIRKNLFCKWPKYSGSIAYPIGEGIIGGHNFSNEEFGTNKTAGTMWVGDYGQLRMELLDFMIHELETNHECD